LPIHAALHQGPVAGLVLVNATGAHTRAELAAFLRSPGDLRARAGVAGDASLFEASLPLMFHDPASPNAQRFARGMASDQNRAGRARTAIEAIIASRDAPLTSRLGEVRVPTLVVWGEGDRLLHPDNRERLAAIPGAALVRIPASGHMPHIETPEAFVRAVAPFLAALD
jgi:pimeloyl-ACP methyl ester carboxylesterase